ncbi:hypothetical protein LCGC14_1761230 [marine sediment metagenome]|uniref:HicB-like antitoxin of toxin-antitoxin system domain-containing protein n=1 Tax=marine sediment metagenome TaxID=412755 RepID=A0A0F9JG04_9ZZZZ
MNDELKEALAIPYSIQISPVREEDGGFVAFMKELGWTFCSGVGDSYEEAFQSLKIAREEVFEYLVERSDFKFPKPDNYIE